MQFRFLPNPEHPLVCLRPLRAADIEPWSRYLNLPEVYEHTSWDHPTPDDLASYLNNELSGEPSSRLRLAIAQREGDEIVGTIGLHTVSAPNRSAELAYDLHPNMWGHGVATAMVGAVVEWAHAHAALIRVQATVLESNNRSVRVLQRSHFLQEGLLQSYRLVRGLPGNFYMYAHVGLGPVPQGENSVLEGPLSGSSSR